MHKLFGLSLGLVLLFGAAPSSTNYTLKTYDIGSGGNSSSSSTNYKLNGLSGSQSGTLQSSTNYGVSSGLNNTDNSNVPPAPTFTNPSSYYDRLKIVLNAGSDPSDTKYLIAISSDNFVTTYYVQADDSFGPSQAITNYQTYATWGGSSGFTVLGLAPSTTYKIKVKALQGNFSGSQFGPIASAATVATSLTMSLATTSSSTPPFNISFPPLVAGGPLTANDDVIVGVTSNALNGGSVYVQSLNGGLTSVQAGRTINAVTNDLSVVSNGYGGQVVSTTQTSGGPFTAQSPYNVTGTNVGDLVISPAKPVVTTTGPITGGSVTFRLLARAGAAQASAPDYSDVLTFISAMNF